MIVSVVNLVRSGITWKMGFSPCMRDIMLIKLIEMVIQFTVGDILGFLVSLFPKATGSSGEIKHHRQHKQLRKVLIVSKEAQACRRHTEGKTLCKAEGEFMKPRHPVCS